MRLDSDDLVENILFVACATCLVIMSTWAADEWAQLLSRDFPNGLRTMTGYVGIALVRLGLVIELFLKSLCDPSWQTVVLAGACLVAFCFVIKSVRDFLELPALLMNGLANLINALTGLSMSLALLFVLCRFFSPEVVIGTFLSFGVAWKAFRWLFEKQINAWKEHYSKQDIQVALHEVRLESFTPRSVSPFTAIRYRGGWADFDGSRA